MGQTLENEEMAALIAACARGEHAALRAIYESEAPRLLAIALRLLKRRSLAEDAVQDAFVKIWNGASGFDPAKGEARGWITTILRNRALNMLRAESRTEWTDDIEAYGLESPQEDPEAIASRLSDAGALRHCLDRLEPKRRIAIVLAYVHGLTHQDIAEKTGLPLGTLKSWIRRSLLSLRECLG